MKANREMLEDQLQRYETQLGSFSSYIKELNDMTAKYGTDKAQFEQDLLEAETNVKYYEGEIARVKKELKDSDKGSSPRNPADSVLPRTVKQGIGSFVLSSISFVTGALIGSKLKARRSTKDASQEKEK
jgi:hypothetical protein